MNIRNSRPKGQLFLCFLLFLICQIEQIVSLDAGAGDTEVAAYRGGGHVAVAKLEDIADEHMVGIDRVVKAFGARKQQIAAAAEQAIFHLIVDIGYEAVAGGLDYGEMEVYLLLKQLCKNKVLSLVEGLVIGRL